MKITIAYLPEEQKKVNSLLRCLHSFLGNNVDRVRENDHHAPYKHIYLTTRKTEKPSGTRTNA